MSRFLLLEDAGSRWAVPEEAVASVEALGSGVLVRLRNGEALRSRRLLGREEGGERPLGPVLSRLFPAGVEGLTVVGGVPVPVVDSRRPPEQLAADEDGDCGKGGAR